MYDVLAYRGRQPLKIAKFSPQGTRNPLAVWSSPLGELFRPEDSVDLRDESQR